jgi:hypothetical protein
MRDLVDQTLTAGGPAAETRHVRLRPRLVDEDQAAAVGVTSPRTPFGPPFDDVRTTLLRGVDRLFLNDKPSSFNATQMVVVAH